MKDRERDLEYQSFKEVREFQIDRIRELMDGEWKKAPGFAKRLKEAGVSSRDLKTADDIRKFPILRKSDLPALQSSDPPFGSMITVPPGRLRRIFSSPGPIYDPEGHLPSYYRWERAFLAAGFREGDIVLNCFSYHLTPAGAMFEEGCTNIGCAVIPAGIGNAEIQAAVASHLKANAYVGLPSYLKVLLEKAAEICKPLALKKAFVIAEKLPESLRGELLNKHGIHVRQAYGTAEVGSIAFECEQGVGMHLDPTAFVEIIDPDSGVPAETGQPGEVVVTPHNPINALLRFATGDLSAMTFEPCRCGRTSPRLTGILGRVDQVTKVRGLFVHPSQVAEALAKFAFVRKYRAIVVRKRAMDDLIVELESDIDLDQEKLEQIADRVKEAIKLGVTVVQVEKGAIPEGAAVIEDRRKWE